MIDWIDGLELDELDDDEHYNYAAKETFIGLCMEWRYISLGIGATSKESAHRKAVDILLEWAFSRRTNVHQSLQSVLFFL